MGWHRAKPPGRQPTPPPAARWSLAVIEPSRARLRAARGPRAQRFNGSHGQSGMTDNRQVARRMIEYRLFFGPLAGGWQPGPLARLNGGLGLRSACLSVGLLLIRRTESSCAEPSVAIAGIGLLAAR